MPPKLALIFFLILIFIILKYEHKEKGCLSGTMWIPTLWLLWSCSKDLGQYLNLQTTMEAGSLPDRIFLIALSSIAVLILIHRKFLWTPHLRMNFPLIAIIGFMLISVIWSDSIPIALRRWIKVSLIIPMSFLVLSETNPLEVLLSIFKKVIYISLPLSLMLIKYFPIYGRTYHPYTGELQWTGIAGQKNGLALLCSFSIIYLFWSLLKKAKLQKKIKKEILIIDGSMILLSIYLMMGPQRNIAYSSTSLSILVIGIFQMIFSNIIIKKRGNINNKIILALLSLIIFIGSIMPFTGKVPIKEIPKLLNRDESLTGRTAIWNTLMPYAHKNLWLGYGYGSFWNSSRREQIAVSAHNGYLETILNLGIIGLALFIIFYLNYANIASKIIKNSLDAPILLLTMIFMLLIQNISESSMTYLNAFPTSFIILFSVVLKSSYPMNEINR